MWGVPCVVWHVCGMCKVRVACVWLGVVCSRVCFIVSQGSRVSVFLSSPSRHPLHHPLHHLLHHPVHTFSIPCPQHAQFSLSLQILERIFATLVTACLCFRGVCHSHHKKSVKVASNLLLFASFVGQFGPCWPCFWAVDFEHKQSRRCHTSSG